MPAVPPCRRVAGEDAERLVERAAKHFAAGRLETVDRPFEMGEAASRALRSELVQSCSASGMTADRGRRAGRYS